MRAYAAHVRCGRVIADKKRGIETRIEAGHHATVARPGAHDSNALGKFVDQKTFAISVRVTHHNLSCSGLIGGGDRSQRFICHEMTESLILKASWIQLVRGA